MDNEKFGKFIAKLRKEKNMTQKEMADKFNLTDKAISKWERGLNFPDISMLKPLAEFFDISVLELLNGEKSETENNIDEKVLKILKQVEREKNRKIKKVIILSIIFVIVILGTYIGLSLSKAKLYTYNPIRAVIGYVKVSIFNEQYVEVANIPTKTIYANLEFDIEEYMKKLGYRKLEGLAIKSGIDDFYTNGENKVLINKYVRKGIFVYEWEREFPYNEEKDGISKEKQTNREIQNKLETPIENTEKVNRIL